MALTFRASTDAHAEIVLSCDESVAAANDKGTLEAYRASGDDSRLVIPDDATRVTIRPLSTRDFTVLASRGRIPQGVLPPQGIQADPDAVDGQAVGAQILAYVSTLPEDEQALRAEELALYGYDHCEGVCALGVVSISDLAGVGQSQMPGRVREYPREVLETLPKDALEEIAAHILRVSQLGKANSGH